jgi:5'(3')-deoxyribonucleotidase
VKTILVDMDSIVADFYFEVIRRYTAETGHVPPPDVLGHWDAKLPNGKDSYAYFKEPGFFLACAPIPGALEFLQTAKDQGHDVLILSAATLTTPPARSTSGSPSTCRASVVTRSCSPSARTWCGATC